MLQRNCWWTLIFAISIYCTWSAINAPYQLPCFVDHLKTFKNTHLRGGWASTGEEFDPWTIRRPNPQAKRPGILTGNSGKMHCHHNKEKRFTLNKRKTLLKISNRDKVLEELHFIITFISASSWWPAESTYDLQPLHERGIFAAEMWRQAENNCANKKMKPFQYASMSRKRHVESVCGLEQNNLWRV